MRLNFASPEASCPDAVTRSVSSGYMPSTARVLVDSCGEGSPPLLEVLSRGEISLLVVFVPKFVLRALGDNNGELLCTCHY